MVEHLVQATSFIPLSNDMVSRIKVPKELKLRCVSCGERLSSKKFECNSRSCIDCNTYYDNRGLNID
jgi:hypothetical protein